MMFDMWYNHNYVKFYKIFRCYMLHNILITDCGSALNFNTVSATNL